MATLTGQTIASTYDGLLKLSDNDGLTASVKNIQDGLGVSSPVNISTAVLFIKPTSDTSSTPTSGKEFEVVGNALITGDLQVDNINIDGNTISATSGVVTLANGAIATTQSQNDNSTKIATTAYVDLAVDGVDTLAEILAIGNTTGSTKISVNNSSSGIDFIDDALLRLGTGNDLVIRHDASNSHIENATGTLNIEANNLRLGNFGTDNYIIATNAGSVELYHNDVKKFETTSTGVSVTGDADVSGKIIVNSVNSFLDGDNLRFSPVGSAFIDHSITGQSLIFRTSNSSALDTQALIIASNADATFAGDITFGDSHFIGDDSFDNLQILASSGENVVIQAPTGNQIDLKTAGGSTLILDSSQNATFAGTLKSNTDFVVQVDADNNTSGSVFKILGGGGSELFRVNEAGEVLTGNTSVSSAGEKFNVTGNGIVTEQTDGGVATMMGGFGGSDGIIGTFTNSHLKIRTNNNDRIVVLNTGNVGIGTTSPNRVLEVSSNASDVPQIRASYNSTNYLDIKHNTLNAVSSGGNDSIQLQTGGTTGLTIDVSQNATFAGNISLADSKVLYIGTGLDLQLFHESHNSFISNNVGDLTIRNLADDKDIIFQSDDGSGGVATYFSLEGANTRNKFEKNIYLLDNVKTQYGSSVDYEIYHDGSDTQHRNFVGDLLIKQEANDKDINFLCDDGSGGTATYFRVDGSAVETRFLKSTLHFDNVKAKFGDSGDLQIYHDGSNSYIQDTGTGDIFIKASNDVFIQGANDEFMAEFSENGSVDLYHNGSKKFETTSTGVNIVGGTSATSTHILQVGNVSSGLGNNTSSLHLSENTTGSDMNFGFSFTADGNSTNNLLIKRHSGSTSGSTVITINRDDDNVTFAGNVSLADSKELIFGNGSDFKITHNGTNTEFNNYNGGVNFVQNQADGDIIFYADGGSGSATEYFRLDGGNTNIIVSKEMRFGDGVSAQFGANNHLQVQHNSSDGSITNATGNLTIQNSADDSDIIFRTDSGDGGTTPYMTLDGSSTSIVISASTGMYFNDSIKARFGTSGDLTVHHSGTDSFITNLTGNLSIQNSADDKDILFLSDDGSGGTATYFFLDGSEVRTTFNKEARFIDNAKLKLGDSGDLAIYHDSANSYVEQAGTGDLIIRNSTDDKDILLQTDNGSGLVTSYIQLDGSDLSTKILTQKVILSNLPTSDPNNAGQLYNESGFLRVSAG